jgi:acyl-CoA thioesterase
MFEFDAATALTPMGDGIFAADLSPDWNVGPIPNGGYLMSVATGAMAAEAGHPDPLSVTVQYLRPSGNGPARLSVNRVKRGRQVDFMVASLVQDGKERLRATGLFGSHARPGGTLTALTTPDLPPPEACVLRAPNPKAPTVAERFDFAIHPDDAGMFLGSPSGRCMLRGWIRFADGRSPDNASIPTFADSFPPPIFQVHPTFDWVPTLELGVQWRRAPSPGWLACVFTSTTMAGGYLEEDGQIWDEQGRVVALTRQLAHIQVS